MLISRLTATPSSSCYAARSGRGFGEEQETVSVGTTAAVTTSEAERSESLLPNKSPKEQYEFAISFMKIGDYETAEFALKEFIEKILGVEGLRRSVVIASPADSSPLLRMRGASLAHCYAEYFRDQGKNVLLLMDSLTRVAHAQREIGLAVGEPPTVKGYPSSVFSLLPKMIERTGRGADGLGSITAIYTVLAEGDDLNDPVVDIARAALDLSLIHI